MQRSDFAGIPKAMNSAVLFASSAVLIGPGAGSLDAQVGWSGHGKSLQVYLPKIMSAPDVADHILARGTAMCVHLQVVAGIDE